MVAITHAFQSAKGDGTDPTFIQPSNWNAAHTVTVAATQRVIGRNSAGSGPAEEFTVSTMLDWLSSTRGSVLYRGATGWVALGPATAGYLLTSGGAGADPAWAAPASGVTLASNGNYRGNVAGVALTPNVVWNDVAPVPLTYAASYAPDFSTFINGTMTLTGNLTLANPTNAKPGQSGFIRLQQDATGSRTISYGTSWKKEASANQTLSTAANTVDVLDYQIISSTEIRYRVGKAVA